VVSGNRRFETENVRTAIKTRGGVAERRKTSREERGDNNIVKLAAEFQSGT
jgi:hypothetical protein